MPLSRRLSISWRKTRKTQTVSPTPSPLEFNSRMSWTQETLPVANLLMRLLLTLPTEPG